LIIGLAGRGSAERRELGTAMSEQSVQADISGSVWKIEVAVGDRVSEDDTLMVLESMKMEIPVASPCAGTILSLQVGEGDSVTEGQVLAVIQR
jgi:acetyl-CoA carboxylase biotin carboxyl carrier protein